MPNFVPRCGDAPCDGTVLSWQARWEEQQRRVAESVDALHGAPGVIAAASFFRIPLVKPGFIPYTSEPGNPDLIRDEVVRFGDRPLVPPVATDVNAAALEFVRALGATLIAGSSFDDPQYANVEGVAIINESLARRLSPGFKLHGMELNTPVLGRTIATRGEGHGCFASSVSSGIWCTRAR